MAIVFAAGQHGPGDARQFVRDSDYDLVAGSTLTQPVYHFAIVPYAIARRSAAAYYPETNVLVPIRSVAAKSNQPAFKCIRITLKPSESCQPLHFSEKEIEHNLNRVVPRLK